MMSSYSGMLGPQRFMEINRDEERVNVKNIVNKELLKQVKELGFSETVAAKALYHTVSKDVETAVNWIEAHQNDPDFKRPLIISRPRRGMDDFGMFGGRSQMPAKKKEISTEVKELQERVVSEITNWQNKMEKDPLLEQMPSECMPMKNPDNLDEMLKRREGEDWRVEEAAVLKRIKVEKKPRKRVQKSRLRLW